MKVISNSHIIEYAIRWCIDEDVTFVWYTGTENGDIYILSDFMYLPDLQSDYILSPNFTKQILNEAYQYYVVGQPYYCPAVTSAMMDKTYRSLTKREKQISKLLMAGLTCREIADQLFISMRTVESHKTKILHKYDVSSTVKLVIKAFKPNAGL